MSQISRWSMDARVCLRQIAAIISSQSALQVECCACQSNWFRSERRSGNCVGPQVANSWRTKRKVDCFESICRADGSNCIQAIRLLLLNNSSVVMCANNGIGHQWSARIQSRLFMNEAQLCDKRCAYPNIICFNSRALVPDWKIVQTDPHTCHSLTFCMTLTSDKARPIIDYPTALIIYSNVMYIPCCVAYVAPSCLLADNNASYLGHAQSSLMQPLMEPLVHSLAGISVPVLYFHYLLLIWIIQMSICNAPFLHLKARSS